MGFVSVWEEVIFSSNTCYRGVHVKAGVSSVTISTGF